MVVLSAKFTILISWSPFCIPLVILSVLIKLEGTSITILYNSLESRHIWRTRIMVKGLDRRVRFDIGVSCESTLIMWISLSPYPSLCKAEKTKSTLRILQKDSSSVYLTHQFCHKKQKGCKIILFLIVSDCSSSIIVSNVSCIRFLRISSINFIV